MKRTLLLLLFWGAGSLFAAESLPINQFSGINTDANSATLEDGQTPDSQNVVTDLGGLQGRKGFIQFSTQVVQDIWQFPLSNGTRYIIKRSSNTLLADTGLGTFVTTVSTIPTDRKTVCSVLGDKFFFMNTTDGLKFWDGTNVFTASAALKGTMLVTHKARLWEAGKTGEERYIRGSKLNDGTTWFAPVNPSDDDSTILPVSGALDENVQAIFASFQDKLVWFKKSSFGGIFGSRRSNFSQRSFSETVGVSAPETIQDCDGFLRWLGNNRKVWEFDGSTYHKISDQDNALFSGIIQGDSATRSKILTSETDWEQGVFGNAVVPAANLTASSTPGSITFLTQSVIVSSDDIASDFGSASTVTNVDTTTAPGSVTLNGTTVNLNSNASSSASEIIGNTGSCPSSISQYQQFLASYSYTTTSLTVRINRDASYGGALTVTLNGVSNTIANASIGTSQSDVSVTMVTSLTAGTTYTITLTPTASSSSGSGVYWYYGTSGSPYALFASSNTFENKTCASVCSCGSSWTQYTRYNVLTRQYAFSVYAAGYVPSGSIVSRTFDISFTTNTWLWNWGTFLASQSLPTGASLTFETQSSADGSAFDSLVSATDGGSITSTVRRYIRYKASFSTTNQFATPTLLAATLNAGPFLKSSGTYSSSLVTVGSNISAWGPITVGNTVSSGGTETFQIGSTNTASLSAISNWTTITNNSVPTISTNPYVAFRSTFTATRATDTVQLNDFTFSWTDGSTLRSASGYIEQRYWLAVATTSLTNNIIYVYDRNKQWQRYIGINADCLGQYNSNLYFGNSTGIFQTEQGYTDAGTNITSYFKTKDYAPSGPDTVTSFHSLYVTADQSDGTLATSVSINGSTVPVALGSYQMNGSPGLLQNFKVPFTLSDVSLGKFINFTWQIVGSSFWRIVNADIYHTKGQEPE